MPIITPAIIAGGGALAGIAGGVVGQAVSAEDRERARAAYQQYLQAMAEGAPLPDIAYEAYTPEEQKFLGGYTPEAEAQTTMGPSAYEKIEIDPRLRQAQINALTQMQEISGTGLSPAEEAELNKLRRDVAREVRGKEQAVLTDLARRGMAGSGTELAARLSAAQAGGERSSEEADRQAAIAFNRRLAAIQGAENIATGTRSQDFGEKSSAAQAADAIAQWNAANRAGVESRRAAGITGARQYAAAGQQGVAASNVAERNLARQANVKQKQDLAAADYERRLNKKKMQAEALKGQGDIYSNEAEDTRKFWGGLGQSVAGGAAQVGSAMVGKKV